MKLKDIILSNSCLLIDFYSNDCPPCNLIEQELVKVKKELGEKIEIYQVDQAQQMDVFTAFQIKKLPHLKLFRSGRPVWSTTGLISKDEIIHQINKWK